MKHNYLPQSFPEKLLFFSSFDENFVEIVENGLTVKKADGPTDVWIGREMTGISGPHTLAASGNASLGKASVLLFDSLGVTVSEDTVFTYHIFPYFLGEHYDFDYSGSYFTLGVYFTDGTRASLVDQNGNALTALSQGKSRTLYTHQWNQLYASLSAYAGKVVDKIVLEYEMEGGKADFLAYFDDISLVDKKPDVKSRPCHRATIFRGTNDTPEFSHGLTTPAVTLPQGFSMYGPKNIPYGTKHYEYLSDNLLCMTVSHEPSIWIGERGSWQFMVNTSMNEDAETVDLTVGRNAFSHKNEIGLAHYYSVSFGEDGADAANSRLEMTPTLHGVAVRFTYGEAARYHSVLFDNIVRDGAITFGADGSFVAYSDHRSFGSGRLYVYGEFSSLPKATKSVGKGGMATFAEDEVVMRFATSYMDHAQAKKNYALELAGRDFDSLAEAAASEWDRVFAAITDVKGAREEELDNLYSGLYYLYKYPNLLSENVGSADAPIMKYFSPYSQKVEEGVMYINNGFWDTYRTAWAGYTLFSPEKLPTLLDGFIRHYHDQGWIPRWSAPGGVNCMVGTSSDIIFADALVKGFEFDHEGAYRSALKDGSVLPENPVNGGRAGMERAVFLGYTPGDDEEFSWSIEGYINDYGIAQMAKILAEREADPDKRESYLAEAEYFRRRALNYPLLFDNGEGIENKWFKGRMADGSFTTANAHEGKFDPLFWGCDYTETDAYNMTVSVVHDGKGLARLYGGPEAMAKKMDTIFTTNDVYRGYEATGERDGIHEQREMREVKLGRFGISNQPSHHIIYMYNHTSDHYKAQKYARDCTKRLFVGARFGQGFPGDEDNGEMSCWYLFSCLGFYPLAIGSGEYVIGSPAFSDITVNYGGSSLRVIAHNNSDENVYIQSAKFNGKPFASCAFSHEMIKNGGVFEFEMGPEPSDWSKDSAPSSLSTDGGSTKPWRDLIPSDVKVSLSDTLSPEAVGEETVLTNCASLAAAFDNNSKTEAILAGGAEAVFSFPEAKTVDAITLTSPAKEGTVIGKVTLCAANDGGEWQTIGEWCEVAFAWQHYTRPFLVKSPSAFKHYKLTLDGVDAISEIELLSE